MTDPCRHHREGRAQQWAALDGRMMETTNYEAVDEADHHAQAHVLQAHIEAEAMREVTKLAREIRKARPGTVGIPTTHQTRLVARIEEEVLCGLGSLRSQVSAMADVLHLASQLVRGSVHQLRLSYL